MTIVEPDTGGRAVSRPRQRWVLAPPLVDVVVAFGAFALIAGAAYLRPPDGGPAPTALGILAGMACGLVLIARRYHPVAVLVAVLTGSALGTLGHLDAPTAIAVPVALYTIATACNRDTTLLALVGAVAATSVTGIALGRATLDALPTDAGRSVVLYGAASALGLYLATRRAYVDALIARAADLEREQALVTRRAVSAERSRIARELHDVVAHHVSVIALQAGSGRAVAAAGAPETQALLDSIHTSAHEALVEMRRLLTVLREEATDDGAAALTDELDPQPSLAEVPALVGRVREAGLDVELSMAEPMPPLPQGVSLSVYRIIQEALTNSLRYSGSPAHANVSVVTNGDRLVLEIADDGRGPRQPGELGAGRGIIGMHERVSLLGGELSAGAGPAGGFRVVATIPLESPGQEATP